MRTRIIFCAAAAILCGCASSEKPPAYTTAYAGKPLATIMHGRPDFAAITWSRTMMMNGTTAGLEGVAEGNGLVREFDVADPAQSIAALLAPALSVSLNTVPADAAPAQGKGLVLDVQTDSWAFAYIPADPAHYRVQYMGRARLIDAATAAEIAAVPCRWESNDKDAPGYDELVSDRAALLKDMLASAAKDCSAAYQKQILALPALQQPAPAAR